MIKTLTFICCILDAVGASACGVAVCGPDTTRAQDAAWAADGPNRAAHRGAFEAIQATSAECQRMHVGCPDGWFSARRAAQ